MPTYRRLLATLATALCVPAVASAASDPKPDAASFIIEAFVEHVENGDYPAEARTFVRKAWQQRRGGERLQQFIPEALAVLEPRFKAGLEACEAGEHHGCARMMAALSLSADPYLSAHGAYFQSKAMVELLQLEYAALLLDYYFREDDEFNVGEYTLYVPDMQFLLGYCRFHTFEIDDARTALQGFLERYAAASPALREAAEDLLAQSEPAPQKTLGQAEVLMTGAEDWLRKGESGIDTQIQQYKALAILEALACEAKKCEKQQCCGAKGCSKCSGGKKQGKAGSRMSQSPATQSQLSGGDGQPGMQHDAPRASPGAVWGQMRPAERAKVLQALQENFPSRYRDLVEQYFTELGKEE